MGYRPVSLPHPLSPTCADERSECPVSSIPEPSPGNVEDIMAQVLRQEAGRTAT